MPKNKNVDSIGPAKIVRGKDQYKTQEKPLAADAPLLSILDPKAAEADILLNVHAKESLLKSLFKKKTTASKVESVEKVEPKTTETVTNPSSLVEETTPVLSRKERRQQKKDAKMQAKAEAREKKNAEKPKDLISEVEAVEEKFEGDKKSFLRRHKRWVAVVTVILGFFLILTALVGGVAYAHQTYYANKVFPGVVVWGEDVGGKTVPQVQNLIAAKIKNYNVTFKGPDQDYKASAQDLGLVFDSYSMALSAYSQGRSDKWYENYLTRARLGLTLIKWEPFDKLIRDHDLAISPSYQLNKDKLTAYLAKISDNIKIDPQDSQVVVDGGATQLKPAIYGRTVELDSLKTDVLSSIGSLESKKIIIKTTVVKPAIVDTAAQDVMLQAQNVMARPVVLTYNGTEYRPNQQTVGSWISFTKAPGDAKYTLVIDQSKMSNYIAFLQSKIDIHSTSRIVRVENGVKETETQAGANGLLVDTGVLSAAIAAKLPVNPSVTMEIPTYVDVFKTEYQNVVVADWDKYIDINISTQTMMACEKGGTNCHQWSVTTGNDSHPTPIGTFLILGRNANFYMTGGTPGVDYYKVWVDHATWFTSQGHAIHDAHWRNGSFGGQDYHWNGSHGCVNSPDDAAIYIYNWAPVGTPVTIHY